MEHQLALHGLWYKTVDSESTDNVITGIKFTLKSIRSFRRGRIRNKIFLKARADGVYPLFIDYEMALEAGENKSNN